MKRKLQFFRRSTSSGSCKQKIEPERLGFKRVLLSPSCSRKKSLLQHKERRGFGDRSRTNAELKEGEARDEGGGREHSKRPASASSSLPEAALLPIPI